MRATIRYSLGAFLLSAIAIGATAGLLALRLRPPPSPHAHIGAGYVLHNESAWAVTLRVGDPLSPPYRVRLVAGESVVLPRRPVRVDVLWRGRDDPVLSLDLTRSGGVGGIDYGELASGGRRCLLIRMRLGEGREAAVE